jgi:transcriptional regulator with XRE-family HTH domain
LAGSNLKDWLKANGLTQEDFEKKSGLPQSTISRVCRGGDSTDDTKRKIYETTNGEVTPNWLVLNKAA